MKRYQFIILSVLFISAILISCTMMTYPFFWYDEAGQFWISNGLNHYSLPNSDTGGLADVVSNNRDYNMDPGGFSVLLWLWCMISRNIYFIRVLPYAFFLFACVCMYKYYRKDHQPFEALLLAILPFAIPIINTRMYEVRAYSMEMLGCVAALLAIQAFKEKTDYKHLIISSFLLLFFSTSRYGFFIVIAYTSVRLLFIAINQWSIPKVTVGAAIYSIPLIIGTGFIYYGMMKYQNGTPSYVGYLSENPKLLLSPLSLLFYANVVLCGITIYLKKRLHELNIAAVIISSLYLLLSVASFYPWDFHRTISASLLLSLSSLDFIIRLLPPKESSLACLGGIIALLLSLQTFRIYQIFQKNRINEPVYELTIAKGEKPKNTVFVQYHYSPAVRYYYEYCTDESVRSEERYPESFIMEVGPKHNADETDVSISERDMLIATQAPDYLMLVNPESTSMGVNNLSGMTHIFIRK